MERVTCLAAHCAPLQTPPAFITQTTESKNAGTPAGPIESCANARAVVPDAGGCGAAGCGACLLDVGVVWPPPRAAPGGRCGSKRQRGVRWHYVWQRATRAECGCANGSRNATAWRGRRIEQPARPCG